ncbi:hypothetical protein BMS3Abin03_00367 [bacterium BMS3Abin03]|nr:hypothetical protein BMS3Abin03_00367 [bacterium BMS3Abin03]
MKKIIFSFAALTIVLTLYSCKSESPKPKGSPEYISEIQQWHQKRIERLKEDNGWLNLVGLYWLKEGKNTFGSAKNNDIKFPGNAPSNIGSFFLEDSIVTVKINPDVNVTNNGNPVKEMNLKNDMTGNPTILETGTLRWYIIKRGDRYGVRLRDIDAPLVKEFKDIEVFPINEDWRFEAKFEPYNPPKHILIPTIIGTKEEDVSPGQLIFNKDGKTYKLDAIDEGDKFFIIFADRTSGEETYGAGRFLYTDKPDSNNIVILDFNKAYNPPCVFTKYATCPLPPKDNYLKLKVTAGEKMWGEQH